MHPTQSSDSIHRPGFGRSTRRRGRCARAATLGGFALACLLAWATPAQAEEFRHGELEGSIDFTISHGVTYRMQERDKRLIGIANGGTANSVNGDDGNLNYDKGTVSNVSKITGELELDYGNFGAFVRVHGFYDIENEDGDRKRAPLSSEAGDLVGKGFEVLDLYVTSSFDMGGVPVDLRLGNHVLNWGESTFIQNGINVINPFDVSKLRTPGAELRDGLLPVPMVSTSVGLNDNVTFEGFYQARWEKTEPDPAGTFFSTSDVLGDKVVFGWGAIPDTGFSFEGLGAGLTAQINTDLAGFTHPLLGALPQPAQAGFDPDFVSVKRARSAEPDDSGQWGLALRYLAEGLNNTEFGFYFINYHSRLPLLAGRTGTAQGVNAGLLAAAAVSAQSSNTTQAIVASLTAAGVPASQLQLRTTLEVGRIAGLLAVDRYAKTMSYYAEYPEDLQLLGVSFNTQLGASGWALQGEYSRRLDAPLQIDDVELLLAALTPLSTDASGVRCTSGSSFSRYCMNQIGDFGTDTYVRGYIERDVSQFQATLTKVFGPMFGANSMAFVTEAAVSYVHNMPDKSELRLEAPGTTTSGNPFHATLAGAHANTPAEPADAFADDTSYGYRLAARLSYLNAIGAVNLYPRLQFQHDVQGNSPGPGGPFLEGRKALTLGLAASYLNRWQFDLSYTTFTGAGRHNLLNDRDSVSATVKYLF